MPFAVLGKRLAGRPIDLLAAARPNGVVPPTGMILLVAIELGLAAALWVTTPYALFPTPAEVLHAFPYLWRHGLAWELWASLAVNLEALAWTTALSLTLSYLTVLPLLRPIALGVAKLRFLGFVGLTFFFTVILASGHALKVALLVFGMTVFFVTAMVDVVAGVPREAFDDARTLRMGEWRVVWEVVVLGTAAAAIDVLRANAAMGWMLLTMVEGLVRSEGGIGAMMLNQAKHLNLAHVTAIMMLILAVGVLQDYALGALGRLACPYASLGRERR